MVATDTRGLGCARSCGVPRDSDSGIQARAHVDQDEIHSERLSSLLHEEMDGPKRLRRAGIEPAAIRGHCATPGWMPEALCLANH